MGMVTMQTRISRTKLNKQEYSPDQTSSLENNKPLDDTNLWHPAGELLAKFISLDENS
ncbi:hypothetical protein [Paenibacillus sp. URB8-2]|uniref:hypothetical protein n=1 Tax=Paenibacillus sp. URB8-2 TaxID=2741301 RepID=UPI0015C199CF|nr:hypothetical protein [Paenibacillus sp. URB8-2]BCG56744.1 hypothetical protein PUR_01690 [Paenibacillus sp. URB8-2]